MTKRVPDDDILSAVELAPIATAHTLAPLLGVTPGALHPRLRKLHAQGFLVAGQKVRSPGATKSCCTTYTRAPEPQPPAEDRTSELLERIAELEAWKQAAIERHPSLDTPPELRRARRALAKQLPDMADAILRGEKDNSPAIKALLDLLTGL